MITLIEGEGKVAAAKEGGEEKNKSGHVEGRKKKTKNEGDGKEKQACQLSQFYYIPTEKDIPKRRGRFTILLHIVGDGRGCE